MKKPQSGFTLIEVIVVMVMISVLAGLVATGMSSSLKKAKIRAVSKNLVSALRYTRGQAVVKYEEKTISFNVKEQTYKAPRKKAVQLPDEVEIELYTAESDIASEAVGSIRFFSDGSSTGGWVKLSHKNKVWKINVNWLTGEISMVEGSS